MAGTLTGNRIVTQNANTLAFTGTSANAFSVDGNTFSVDAAGNQVGIGTTTPGEKLDVKGAITYVGQAVANKTGAASIDYASSTVPAQARILSWGPDAATNGIISFWTGLGGAVANEKMRIHSNGNVGIGTVTPQKSLHVNGALQVTNELNVGGNATTAGSAGTAGQILISGGAGAAPSWQNASAASVNIYNADGILTGNRVVTQGANTLAFTGTSTNAFSVDGNTLSVDAANNRIGIGTNTPQKSFHVNGTLQVTNELNVGGNGTTAGNAGISGQILVSGGAGAAPTWQMASLVRGTVAATYYVQGTSAADIAEGVTADVPGVTITVTVPAGRTQVFMFTILGYATAFGGTANDISSQGVFSLLQNGIKISSAYTSKVGGAAGLSDLPIPVTFLKSVSLPSGTYTFKVQYSSWSGNQRVNHIPSNYGGYNGDSEAMLTKMQVLVYNN